MSASVECDGVRMGGSGEYDGLQTTRKVSGDGNAWECYVRRCENE